LLTTYEVERRPVAWFAAKHSMTGPGTALLEKAPVKEKPSEFFPIVGYRYYSDAVLSEGAAPPDGEIALLDREELTGIPGTRIPHVWLIRGAERISTLDLIDGRFILLAGEGGSSWCRAGDHVARLLGVKLAMYRVAADGDLVDPQQQCAGVMGISADGAILIRPDGFVAWRNGHMAASPEKVIDQVLRNILCRSESIRRQEESPDRAHKLIRWISARALPQEERRASDGPRV